MSLRILHRACFVTVGLGLALTAAGCFSLDRDAPAISRYVLEMPDAGERAPVDAESAGSRPVVSIGARPFAVAAAYAGRKLVYRTGPVEIEADFYHEYVIPPAVAVTEAAVECFGRLEGLEGVHRDGGASRAAYWIEGDLLQIHARTEGGRTTAVLEVRFVLVDASTSAIVWRDTYLAERAVRSDAPRDVVQAQSLNLADLLERSGRDLQTAVRALATR